MPLNFKQDERPRSPYLLLGILLVLSLVCVTMYAREGEDGAMHRAQSVTSGLFAPLKVVSGTVGAAQDSIGGAISDATAPADTLTALKAQDAELRETVAQMEEYRQEAERLRGLLELRDRYDATGVTCRVLSRSTDSWNRVITIDTGTAGGVRAGLPVVGASGLIGQVISAGEYTAEVRLLEDPQTGVAVMIQSNREQGILRGSFDGLMYLEDVDSDVDVQAGDVIITSGLGGGFYRGIMVGTVVKVDGATGDMNRRIIVSLNADVAPLEEVLVLTGMGAGDATADDAASAGEDGEADGPAVSDRAQDERADLPAMADDEAADDAAADEG